MEIVKSKVTILPCLTRLDVPVDRVLNAALREDLAECIVLGKDKNGELYLASSIAKEEHLVYLLRVAEHDVLSGKYLPDTVSNS